jgi:hypothetical protein
MLFWAADIRCLFFLELFLSLDRGSGRSTKTRGFVWISVFFCEERKKRDIIETHGKK